MKKFLVLLVLSLALAGCGEKSKVSDRAKTFMQEVFIGDATKATAMIDMKDLPVAMKAKAEKATTQMFQMAQGR